MKENAEEPAPEQHAASTGRARSAVSVPAGAIAGIVLGTCLLPAPLWLPPLWLPPLCVSMGTAMGTATAMGRRASIGRMIGSVTGIASCMGRSSTGRIIGEVIGVIAS